MTFNHGVEGSSPSALTNEIKHLGQSLRSPKTPCVCTVSANQLRSDGVIMDGWIIGAAIVVALYIALRLVLRHYFPPGT